jgi:hypothetical protein
MDKIEKRSKAFFSSTLIVLKVFITAARVPKERPKMATFWVERCSNVLMYFTLSNRTNIFRFAVVEVCKKNLTDPS